VKDVVERLAGALLPIRGEAVKGIFLASLLLTSPLCAQDTALDSLLMEGGFDEPTELIDTVTTTPDAAGSVGAELEALFAPEEETVTSDTTDDDWDFLAPTPSLEVKKKVLKKRKVSTPQKKKPKKKAKKPSKLRNHGVFVTIGSPYAVSQSLKEWNSFLDWSLAWELPYKFSLPFAGLNAYPVLDIGSYNFQWFIPSSGRTFKGVFFLPQVALQSKLFPYGRIQIGVGAYGKHLGFEAGARLEYQIKSFYMTWGTRFASVQRVSYIGTASWLDSRWSVGIRF